MGHERGTTVGSHSTVLTVGTLLSRAETAGSEVRVLVGGTWLTGVPVACDGHGVVLDAGHGQSLIRIEAISAITFDDPAGRVPTPRSAMDGITARAV